MDCCNFLDFDLFHAFNQFFNLYLYIFSFRFYPSHLVTHQTCFARVFLLLILLRLYFFLYSAAWVFKLKEVLILNCIAVFFHLQLFNVGEIIAKPNKFFYVVCPELIKKYLIAVSTWVSVWLKRAEDSVMKWY